MVFQVWHTTEHDTGITKIPLMGKFFGMFANYKKRLLALACLTVRLCLSVWNNLAPTGQNLMKSYIRDFYENRLGKFKFC